MTKEKNHRLENDMKDVIETSRGMRNYLLNEEISLEERQGKLKVYKTALEANKNIVSASVVQVNLENFNL